MRDHILYLAIAGFIGGVAFRSFFDFGWPFPAFLLLLTAAVFAAALGVLRFDITDWRQDSAALNAYLGQAVAAEGRIVVEPDERENSTRLIVAVDAVKNQAPEPKEDTLSYMIESRPARVLVVTERFPKFSYGDRVSVEGKLQKPESFETDTGRVFDYPQYLAKDSIFYQISFAKVALIGSGEGSSVKHGLFTLKEAFLSRIEAVIPEPHSALLGGLLVGAKQSLGKELQDDFRKTGIIHIVVLSGYNLTLVAGALMWFFGTFLKKRWRLSVGALTIVLFVIMVGASATAVRAGLMALLVLLAQGTGRTYQITRALILTGFLMVLHNPYVLLFDPSFQLSFLATLGLIQLAPRVERYFRFIPAKGKLREIVGATIATQIFVLPLLLSMSGEFSVVGLIVNLLILPTVAATMLFGFLTGVAGFVSSVLSMPFAFITYALLTYQLKIVELFASLPFASVTIPYFPAWLMLGIYATLIALVYRFSRTSQFTLEKNASM